MSERGIRWTLAVIVTLVLGGAILGIAQGGGSGGGSGGGGASSSGGGGGATTAGGRGGTSRSAQQAAAKRRLAALGPVAVQGRKVFTGDSGCSGCHALADAGTSGTIGPDLDTALSRQSLALIRQGIVDPGAVIAEGYPSDVMPNGFGSRLSKSDLDALVRYLFAATHAG